LLIKIDNDLFEATNEYVTEKQATQGIWDTGLKSFSFVYKGDIVSNYIKT